MTEPRSPLDQILDLLVYAPVGLALAVRDELPRLVEKGRSQTDSQVAMARMLGQMAAGKGQQEMGKVLNDLWARLSGGAGSTPEQPHPATPAPAPTVSPSESPAPSGPAAPSAEDLAIPGYDALSAPQVVQRLSGLSSEELEAVSAYEAASRQRQTILGRITQLRSDGS
ncbi:MAG TPA: hypothetical protein VMZ51_09125 [Acidimicrobiales bacterium]|nr:hypothetical protein [Acidimicrobiales bacterium]